MTFSYDDRRPAGSRWTRTNIGEAIPGVPTPLSWSIWQPAMEHAYWWSQAQLGVATRAELRRAEPVTCLASGRPAISVDLVARQVARLPGMDPDAFVEQYFSLPPNGTAAPAGGWRLVPRIAARTTVAAATLGRRVRSTVTASEAAWVAGAWGPPPGDPLAALCRAAEAFIAAMDVHTLQGQLCQGAFERLAALAGDLAPRLVSGYGTLDEVDLARGLWAVSRGRATADDVIRRHGFHGPDEGELFAPSWREDPEPVHAAAEVWAAQPDDRSPEVATSRQRTDRRDAERELLARLPRTQRAQARVLLEACRRLVPQREAGKAAFLRHLDVARRCARLLGDEAMWYTLDELRRDARLSTAELEARQLRRTELVALELPTSWTGDPVPCTASPLPNAGAIEGQPVTPGIIRGSVRVVVDPTGAAPIGPDEVLVANTTDPSWVTLFLTAGALVTDVGGALSHAAIVARELGIPCVVGTGDATTRLRDGDEVEVDGGAGTVTLLPLRGPRATKGDARVSPVDPRRVSRSLRTCRSVEQGGDTFPSV